MHHVLEAKLVVGNMVFSIGTEFIENENEEVTKQDCEIKAFHRLAEKIKKTYKRLPICILGDSLYACEPVFDRCNEYKRNAKRLISVGRSRWKIENQGFNNQKNISYHIEHANSHNYTAMKNHYLLTQITDILVQLFKNGLKC